MTELAPINKVAVIITALEVETRAVLRLIGPWTDENVNGTSFFRGEFEGWDIAVAETGAGNVSAAAVTTRAIERYHPSVALFIGVGGGVKDGVLLGNVVVATKVYGYETGKDTATGFKTRPDAMVTAHEIQQRARVMRQRDDWKKRIDATLQHQNLEILVGPIAAGEVVVASKCSNTAKFLEEHYGDALAVEMEGRGFLEGIHINHPVLGGVMRGISDLLSGKAGADKSGSQKRAADSACAVAFELLSVLGGNAVSAASPGRQVKIEAPTTFSPSAYFKLGDILGRVGDPNTDEMRFLFKNAPDAYLRIIPSVQRDDPISLPRLRAAADSFEMVRRGGNGGFTDINKYGAIFFEPPPPNKGGETALHRATQLFPTGEIWSVSDDFVIRTRGGRPSWVPLPLFPALSFELAFYKAIHRNVAASLSLLDLSFPCTIELGVLGISDAHLAVTTDDLRRIRSDTGSCPG